jgi:hypothetical protein
MMIHELSHSLAAMEGYCRLVGGPIDGTRCAAREVHERRVNNLRVDRSQRVIGEFYHKRSQSAFFLRQSFESFLAPLYAN